MANVKIVDLPQIVTQNSTDIYEVSANGAESFKESRAQMVAYIQDHVGSLTHAIYVSNSQTGTGTGTIGSPFATITEAQNAAVAGTNYILIDSGSYACPASIDPNIPWFGINTQETIVTGSAPVVNNVLWSAATTPYLYFKNINFNVSTLTLSPSTYKAGSIIDFELCTLQNTVVIGGVENLLIDNTTVSADLTINHTKITRSNQNTYSNNVTIQDGDSTNVPNIFFFGFGDSYELIPTFLVNANVSGGLTKFNVNMISAKTAAPFVEYEDVDQIIYPNEFTFTFDNISYPLQIFSNTLQNAIVLTSEEWPTVNTNGGFGNNSYNGDNRFFWTGSGGGQPYTFVAGYNAHTTGTSSYNILLGRSTSSKNNSFVAAEQTGVDFFPTTDNQFVVRYLNGYGFCTGDPKANFHVKAGNTGGFLVSANAQVTSGNVSAGELNPYITAGSLIFAGKFTGGGTFSYDLSTYPTLAGNNTFTGTNTFSSPMTVKEITNPLVQNLTPVSLSATSGTIASFQLVGGIIAFSPSADATWTFPTGSDIDSILNTPNPNRGRARITFVNQSAFNITFSTNTGLNFGGLGTSGTLFMSANSELSFDLVKIDNTPTYTLFGPSYGTLSYLIQNYSHVTSWQGPYASAQAGTVTITRIADQVYMTLPSVSAATTSASTITNTVAIPSQFRPSATSYIGVPSIINTAIGGGVGNGAATIDSSGNITIYQSGANTNFPSGQTCGFQRQTLNWSIL